MRQRERRTLTAKRRLIRDTGTASNITQSRRVSRKLISEVTRRSKSHWSHRPGVGECIGDLSFIETATGKNRGFGEAPPK